MPEADATASRRPNRSPESLAKRREYNRRYRAEHPEYFRDYGRRWRAEHPKRLLEYNRRYRAKRPDNHRRWSRGFVKKRQAWLSAFKLERGCADCGYREHPAALEFDHIGTDKVADISRLRLGPWDQLLAEIAKCEVVCANCHRVRTARRHAAKSGQMSLLDP